MTPSQSLFSFKGRLNRAKFWQMHFLIISYAFSVKFIANLIARIIIGSIGETAGNVFVVLILLLMGILGGWSVLAVTVKRWHDRDKSGWWILIHFLPIIGTIWAIVELGFLKGTKGYNRFGLNPLYLS